MNGRPVTLEDHAVEGGQCAIDAILVYKDGPSWQQAYRPLVRHLFAHWEGSEYRPSSVMLVIATRPAWRGQMPTSRDLHSMVLHELCQANPMVCSRTWVVIVSYAGAVAQARRFRSSGHRVSAKRTLPHHAVGISSLCGHCAAERPRGPARAPHPPLVPSTAARYTTAARCPRIRSRTGRSDDRSLTGPHLA